MKTRFVTAYIIGMAMCLTLSLQAEQGSKTRAALKAKIHEAVEAEDWIAVKNLEAALAKLDTTLGKLPAPQTETESISPAKKPDFFAQMVKAGFSLQLAPDDDNPAKFAFSRDIQAGTKTVYTADFFLAWRLPTNAAAEMGLRQRAWDLYPSASVQGKLTTADDSSTDAWRFRATLKGRYTWNALAVNPDRIVGILWDASLKDEASRGFDYNRVSGEFNLTPSAPGLAMGTFKPATETDENGQEVLPAFQFRWRPFIGLDAGTTTSDAGIFANGAQDTLWLTARCTAKLKLNAIARALNFDEVSLFADDKLIYLSEARASHNYLKAGLNLMITANVGFSLDYTVGEASPKFNREEVFAGAFTIRFK
jgi:hypothetical protein